jgi:pyrroloquinoline-quinone synthase
VNKIQPVERPAAAAMPVAVRLRSVTWNEPHPQMRDADALEARLREIGATRYHNLHPFHKRLHGGKCTKGQVQAWALNRYYYQSTIPMKDGAVLARMRDPRTRLEWRHRLEDHDGTHENEGGIARWFKLTDGLGLDREYVTSTRGILPATRFAVDAYLNFTRDRPTLEGVASSLTELFAPGIHRERISGMLESYSFITDDVMAYFRKRLNQAPRDADWCLEYVRTNARTQEEREAVCDALLFKCEVLWTMLDALDYAYVHGNVPPGAFVPEA